MIHDWDSKTKRKKLDNLKRILTLDAEKDHQEICFLSGSLDFPWDTQRALELALLRTFAIPKTSQLLLDTQEFTQRTQKRYDDTSIIISTIGLYGYDSTEGRSAIRRMNQMHGHYNIPNHEFLYVLSTFVLEPIRWNQKYGWRKLSTTEKQANYYYWREVGKRMNIKDIPDSLEELELYSLGYEAEHFAFSEANHALAVATRDLFLSWALPKFMWPFGSQFVYAIMDKPMRDAFGFPEAAWWAKASTKSGLWFRKMMLQFLPPRKQPYELKRTRTYPTGHNIEDLGTHLPSKN